MIGVTLFVIAMIASYSGAFAKPTLHHMAVAVAGPQQVVDGIRGQESLAVTKSTTTPPPASRSTSARPTPHLSSPRPAR